MLMTREAICQDAAVDRFTNAILDRDQPRTADLFFQLVKRDGRSIADALSVVTAAEAPFVQVPNHINVRDGQITLINNDHTILGLRTSTSLMPYRAGSLPAAPAAAERVVCPRRPGYLEPVTGKISRSLRHDEGAERTAAGSWSGSLAR